MIQKCLHHQAEESSERSQHQAVGDRQARRGVEDRRGTRTVRCTGCSGGTTTGSSDESRRGWGRDVSGIGWGGAARGSWDQTDCCGDARAGGGSGDEADLRNSHSVSGVSDGGHGDCRGRSDRDHSALGNGTGGSCNTRGRERGSDCWDQSDG